MERLTSLSFPWVLGGASKRPVSTIPRRRKTDMEGSHALAGMLLAAVLAAFLVVADQLIDTWTDGHLLLMWVALWVVAFAVLALLAPPLRQMANAISRALVRRSQGRARARADATLWQVAQADSRVRQEIQVAMTRSAGSE